MSDQKVSSIVTKDVEPLADHVQFSLDTWFLVGFLIVFMVVLKKFIYIKDDKRHGK